MNEATTPQKDYILSLLAARLVESDLRQTIEAGWDTLTKPEASIVIDALKNSPYLPKNLGTLATLPHAKYAVPVEMVEHSIGEVIRDSLLFLEVKEFKGTIYMRRLHGSWGGFSKTKLTRADERVVCDVIATDPMAFIKKFGEHYARCARCGAELTDEKSRATYLGPDCRKALGVS